MTVGFKEDIEQLMLQLSRKVYLNNMELLKMQYSLIIAGVVLILGTCGLVVVRNGKFSLARNFASLRPGKV